MSQYRVSRREVVKLASSIAGLGAAGALIPFGRELSAEEALESLSSGFMAIGDPRFSQLSSAALEGARAAGAQFADVRINVQRLLALDQSNRGAQRTFLRDTAELGVRALVDGVWGFAGTAGVTADNARDAARLAVARGRAARSRRGKRSEIAPVPVVREGRWITPIEIDPFTVPIRHQHDFMVNALQAAVGGKSAQAIVEGASANLFWMKSDRVYASTDGSFISQRTHSALPAVTVRVSRSDDETLGVSAYPKTLRRGGYGYEVLTQVKWEEALRSAAEEALRIASLPARSVDVGRYDVVLSPTMMAQVVVDTIGRALELDRARGDKADTVGTSYAMPPLDVLGKYQLGAPLLTVTADRSRPKANATVGWDEEGVKPEEFVLVKDGMIIDFITTRSTASELTKWYDSMKAPLRSHGCASRSGGDPPILQVPNLSIQPGKNAASTEDLIKDVKRGFYIEYGDGGTDQQCLNAQYAGGLAYEIRDGKRIGRALNLAIQFSTPQFWKSLFALGGPGSASLEHLAIDRATDIVSQAGVQSVPARFRQVNVINTGKQA